MVSMKRTVTVAVAFSIALVLGGAAAVAPVGVPGAPDQAQAAAKSHIKKYLGAYSKKHCGGTYMVMFGEPKGNKVKVAVQYGVTNVNTGFVYSDGFTKTIKIDKKAKRLNFKYTSGNGNKGRVRIVLGKKTLKVKTTVTKRGGSRVTLETGGNYLKLKKRSGSFNPMY